MTIIYCVNCGHGGSFEMADKIVERCHYCPRLEAYKEMKLFVLWYSNNAEPDYFVGVYTSEAKAKNDGTAFERQRNKLSTILGHCYYQTIEPNKMANPKVFA